MKESEEFLGFCKYCKSEVYRDGEEKVLRKKVYHKFCYEQENGCEELNFEKEKKNGFKIDL